MATCADPILDYFDDLVPVKDEIPTQPARTVRINQISITKEFSTIDNMERHVIAEVKGANPAIPVPPSNEQRNVGKWTRGELEDRYFRLYDESLILKKHGRKQEDKIKRLTTKLLRLISDRKKIEQDLCKDGNARRRDIETEQLIEEMQDKIRELEHNNKLVHEKLIVSRQQLVMQLKRPVPSAYRHISTRLDTGIPKQAVRISGSTLHGSGRESRSPHTRYIQSPLVENVKIDASMDDNVDLLRRQINSYEQELRSLKDALHLKEIEHDDELVAVKSQLTQDQRQLLQENISVIRLQRELKQRASQLIVLESHCAELDKNLEVSRKSHDQVLSELDSLGQELKNEQQRNLTLQDEMRVLVSNSLIIAEMKEKNSDLENENKILKESNNVLLNSALNSVNKENNLGIVQDPSYKSRILQLEAALSHAKDEQESMMKANGERDQEFQELHISYLHLKKDYDDLKNRLKLFNESSDLNLEELEEALSVVHQRNELHLQAQIYPDAVEQENLGVLKQELLKAQADHVETISELEKTRNMLVAQHRINQDYQKEVENVSIKLTNTQQEYESRIADQTHQLNLQAASIQRLEQSLKNIDCASNNQKFNSETDMSEVGITACHESPGENVFEIHLNSVEFSKNVFGELDISNIFTFVTWTFYVFGLQTTPATRGFEPKFDFISQYAVPINDAFLHFIDKGNVEFKLHLVIGPRNKAIAVGEVVLQEMLQMTERCLRKKVPLIGIGDKQSGTSIGFLDLTFKLTLSVAEALLFKKRRIALGYLPNSSPDRTILVVEDDAHSKITRKTVNNLHINIIRCNKIQSRTGEVKPSAYCVYKFNSKSDHATAIVNCNNNPEFNDHMTYHCEMDSQLHDYMKTQTLEMYVFDDNDPKLSAYLGMASIPLLQLTKSEGIIGVFELKMANGNLNGSIEISVCWQFKYDPPHSMTPAVHIEDKLSEQKTKQYETLLPTPMPRTLMASQQLNDTFAKTDKKPPLFPRETKKITIQNNNKLNIQIPSSLKSQLTKESHHCLIENSTASLSSSASESNSDSESDAVVIAVRSNKRQLDMEIKSHNMKATNLAKTASGSSMGLNDDDSDNEIVVFADTDALLRANKQDNYSIIILVSHLTLMEHAAVLKDDKVQMLFVEYRFLDYSPEELETPFALPKPKPNQKIAYNFRKVFYLHPEKSAHRRQYLAKMISSPSKSRLKFTIVSEPLEDNQTIDCEDIGYSYVDLNKILRNQKDIIEEDIGVYDVASPTVIIGHLNVTIKAFSVLQSL